MCFKGGFHCCQNKTLICTLTWWFLKWMDNKSYTSIHQVGSRRCHTTSEENSLLPLLGSGPYTTSSGSGFLSVEEYREILRFATQRHIEVIPEIDMPGHCHAAVKAMQVMCLWKHLLCFQLYTVLHDGQP